MCLLYGPFQVIKIKNLLKTTIKLLFYYERRELLQHALGNNFVVTRNLTTLIMVLHITNTTTNTIS